jgi:HSP20 family protein
MALVRWNPYAEMSAFRRQLDRLFDDIASQSAFGDHPWQPAIELEDSGENLLLKAQLPGLKADDLDISASRDSISISGEYRTEEESESKGTYHSEFRYGKFSRTINLPVEIQQDQVTADYQDGIVTLTLPKVEDAVNRPVKINLGEEANPALSENN